MATIQQVISKVNVLNDLIKAMPDTDPAKAELLDEAGEVMRAIKSVALSVGAGNFPNTFKRTDGTYVIVNSEDEEMAEVAAGAVVATFPQTMVRFGSPDLVVNNPVEKDAAIDQGYTLPGLGPLDPDA